MPDTSPGVRCEVRNDVLGQQCVGCFAAAIESHLTRTYGLTRESVALLPAACCGETARVSTATPKG